MMLKNCLKVLLISLGFSACSDTQNSRAYQLSGSTMGTSYNITVVGENRVDPDIITASLEFLENTLSTYREDSELMQLNKAPANTWINISQDLYKVLKISEEVSLLSDGAFDTSIAPLIDLWGFGPDKTNFGSPPDVKDIQTLMGNVGYQYLMLAADESAVLKTRMVKLDLSAVAKGYAVDVIADLLATNNINNYLVEIGGEIYASGHNAQGEAWHIAIESPEYSAERIPVRIISASDLGIASSGDYRNFYEVDDVHYSHTLDPRKGYPVNHKLASVTVLADSAARADALATAFNVLGTEQAIILADKNNIPAYFLENTDDGLTEHYSSAFTAYIK
jgi:thiamine biosynthesis lipoprotein